MSSCISSWWSFEFCCWNQNKFYILIEQSVIGLFPRTEHTTHSFSNFPDKIKVPSPIFGMRKQNGIYLIFTHFMTVWFLGRIFLLNMNLFVWVSFPYVILGWKLSSCLTLDSTQRNSFRKYVKGKKFPTESNSLKCSNDTSKLLN